MLTEPARRRSPTIGAMDTTAGTVASARSRYRARSPTVATAARIGAPIRITTGPDAATALIDLRRCIASVQANHRHRPCGEAGQQPDGDQGAECGGDDAEHVQPNQGHCCNAEDVAGGSQQAGEDEVGQGERTHLGDRYQPDRGPRRRRSGRRLVRSGMVLRQTSARLRRLPRSRRSGAPTRPP